MELANNRELEEVGNGSPRWVMLYVAGIDACYRRVKKLVSGSWERGLRHGRMEMIGSSRQALSCENA